MEAPEQASITEEQVVSAISAVRSALENNPQLVARFREMLAGGKLQRDTAIVLALSRDARALRQFLSLLEVHSPELVSAFHTLVREETPPGETSRPEAVPVEPAALSPAGKPDQGARPALDIAALVGESPFQPPTSFPPRPVLYAQLGHTYLHEGEQHQQKRQLNHARSAYLRAVEALGEALRRAPNTPELHLYMGDAHERLGRDAEALRHYAAALPLLPEKAMPLLSRIHQMLAAELAPALAERREVL